MSLDTAVQNTSILCCVSLIIAVLPGIYAGELFPWHPLFMAVGFLGFMCEGMLGAYRFRSTDGPPRVAAIANHMWVQLAAACCIILGFLAIYYNKVRRPGRALGCQHLDALSRAARCPSCHQRAHPPRPRCRRAQALHGKRHFTSLHGKVGLITTLLVAAAPTLGFLSFRKLGLLTRLPPGMQPKVKWAHRLVSRRRRRRRRRRRPLHLAAPHRPASTRACSSCSEAGVQLTTTPLSPPLPQLGAVTWSLAILTMQLDLPHPAVLQVRGPLGHSRSRSCSQAAALPPA
jgi:hypothetical protein